MAGDELQRLLQSTVDTNQVVGTSSGVALAWYVQYVDSSGNSNLWLSNAANRLDLNAIRNGGSSSFSVALSAANFQSFPAWPQGTADFATSIANAQYFGLLVTTATAAGSDFSGHNITEWIDVDGGPWNPYATQRNGNYGAYSTGSTTIGIANAVPAPGALALLGAAGLLGSRRRR